MKVWDTRLPDPCVHTLPLPDKVYTMDATDDRVVIGMNNRHVCLLALAATHRSVACSGVADVIASSPRHLSFHLPSSLLTTGTYGLSTRAT